jgi:superfamily II DNA or RNA helicase
MKKVFIVIGNKHTRIVGRISEELEISLPNLLGYRKKMKDQYGQLTNRLCTKYNRITQAVPVGLTDRLIKNVSSLGYEYKVLDKRDLDLINPKEAVEKMTDFPIGLRPYQIKAFLVGLKEPLMTFSMATGGGKTILFAALAFGMGLKTLILVNREDLLTQHYETMKRLFPHESIGLIQGNKLEYDKPVCVGMVQTLNARLKQGGERAKNPRYRATKFLEKVEYIVSDECHHSQSKTWKKVVKTCKNQKYHHGFSGSPWDRGSANLELETVCGTIKYRISSTDLIEQGWLSRPYITFHQYEGNEDYITGGGFQDMYTNTIVDNRKRNKAIIKVIKEEYDDTDRKILVIVNRIKHGHIIAEMLRRRGIDDREIGYLHGKKGKIVREKGKKKFEKGDIRILIASHIFNEGIDIPSCDTLVKCDALGGGDSVFESEGIRNFVQQIGRILRKPQRNNKDVDISKEHVVYVHDFIDKQNEYVKKHTSNRIDTCRQEKAFKVNVEGAIVKLA